MVAGYGLVVEDGRQRVLGQSLALNPCVIGARARSVCGPGNVVAATANRFGDDDHFGPRPGREIRHALALGDLDQLVVHRQQLRFPLRCVTVEESALASALARRLPKSSSVG